MLRDDRVFVMGEDVGTFGGAFRVTVGLAGRVRRGAGTRHADRRGRRLSGRAVGAAIVGLRPVCEMQFADFVACGFDQLVNVAGKMHYRLGLAVPIVVRLPSGGGFSGGPVSFAEPGGVVHARAGSEGRRPSTPRMRRGFCNAAIHDPNPVVFLEHKHLYRRVKGEVPEGIYETPFTVVAHEGVDMMVITYGAMLAVALRGG